MNRRYLPTLTAWLLPLLCLRALLPSGFMPAATEDGLRLALCSGGFYKALPAGNQGQPIAPQTSADSMCLFALAAANTGPAPAVVELAGFVPHAIGSISSFQFDRAISRRPIRAQQSRAPPYFS